MTTKHTPGTGLVPKANPRHTLGPWEVYGQGRMSVRTVDGSATFRVAEADAPTTKEARANAQLIAAAPEMYRALLLTTSVLHEECHDTIDASACTQLTCVRARAAIAKAEGREP